MLEFVPDGKEEEMKAAIEKLSSKTTPRKAADIDGDRTKAKDEQKANLDKMTPQERKEHLLGQI